MATAPPPSTVIELPGWIWNGAVRDFLAAARLRVLAGPASGAGAYRIEIAERTSRERPGLVSSRKLAGLPLGTDNYGPLASAEAAAKAPVAPAGSDFQARLDRGQDDATRGAEAGFLAPAMGLHQLQTMLADRAHAAATVQAVVQDLRAWEIGEDEEHPFPHAGAHLITRDPALLHRSKIPPVLLRIARDTQLQNADLDAILKANSSGEVVFAASDGLGEGMAILTAYLTPLLGALSPYVWAYSASRPSGTIIYTLGRAIAGVSGGALEPLQLLPARSARSAPPPPSITPAASDAAITWWARRIDKALSVVSDPAIFSDASGNYVARWHQHALLSVDQVFSRVGAIQRNYRDGDARRVLLFTVLDTLERLTGRKLVELCTHSFALRTLAAVRHNMNSDAQKLLLPAAERAVGALAEVQEGFYLRRQTGSQFIEFALADGTIERYTPERAAAEYIRVLRNATHGHGSNRDDAVPRTDALLAHHDGNVPHDLALLGYLYLLELLTKPALLRQVLVSSPRI